MIYGSRGKHLISEEVSGVESTHCKQKSTHTISVFGRYAHIFWTPLFSLEKKGVSECTTVRELWSLRK